MSAPMPLAAVACTVLLLGSALSGCDGQLNNMADQPKRGADAHSPLFADGRATRPPPEGSVAHARGTLAVVSSGRAGHAAQDANDAAQGQQALTQPLTRALLRRGQERYAIYCAVCHGSVGDGRGPVVQRGFPAPPSYHIARLRDAPDRHFYDVITHGHGVMYSYADRVEPADRWAIVAYIRALQLSQHAPVGELAPALTTALTDPAAAAVAPASSAARRTPNGTN